MISKTFTKIILLTVATLKLGFAAESDSIKAKLASAMEASQNFAEAFDNEKNKSRILSSSATKSKDDLKNKARTWILGFTEKLREVLKLKTAKYENEKIAFDFIYKTVISMHGLTLTNAAYEIKTDAEYTKSELSKNELIDLGEIIDFNLLQTHLNTFLGKYKVLNEDHETRIKEIKTLEESIKNFISEINIKVNKIKILKAFENKSIYTNKFDSERLYEFMKTLVPQIN